MISPTRRFDGRSVCTQFDQNLVTDPFRAGFRNRHHAIVRFSGKYGGRPWQAAPADDGGCRHRHRANLSHSGRQPEQLAAIAGKPAIDRIGAELLREA